MVDFSTAADIAFIMQSLDFLLLPLQGASLDANSTAQRTFLATDLDQAF